MKVRNRAKRILRVLPTLAVIAVIGLAACGPRNATVTPVDGSARTAKAFVGDLAASASASGLLLPQQEARLALGIAGRVQTVYVQVGDMVRADDVLVALESTDLERAVESAAQSLAINEANLAELGRGPKPADLAAAQAAVDSAQAQLADLIAGPSESELAQAQAALTSARARLDDLVAGPSQEELAQARASLASARAGLEAAKAHYEALDDQLVVAQNDINNAQLAIDRARDMYDQLIWSIPQAATSWGPYSPQAAALRAAEINYKVAVANYALSELDANDASLRGAEAQLAQAEAALATLIEEQTAQIAAARAQLARAEANLAALTRENTAQVAAARAQVAQATANLARLLRGPSAEQLAIAGAQVEQARISLEDAIGNLEAATLTAPFAGQVTAVHVAVGELVGGLAIELVNTESLHVVLDVDEIDIGAIRVGQPALITVETWPNERLTGNVTSIAPTARSVAGIVTYEVHLSLNAGDLPVLTGMTATAELITAQREGVLLIPNRAVIADRSQSMYYVRLVRGGESTRTEITVGLRDGTYTEVTDGLAAGDEVLIGAVDEGLDFTAGPPEGMREMRP